MLISKVSKETDDKEMKNFSELLQVSVLELVLVRVSHDNSVYKLFKLYILKIIKKYMTHIYGDLAYVSENIDHQTDT